MRQIFQKALYHYAGHIPRQRPYVFGIGLSKTGTTSLNVALNQLGFHAVHLPPATRITADGQIALDWPWWMSKADAATDLSVAAVFPELRALFPRARFIYTPRKIDSWLDSCRRHFTQDLAAKRIQQKNFHLLELSQAFYGSFLYDEALYRAAYERHDTAVRAAFASDPAFFEYDLISGAGWAPLCAFLECAVPDIPFPSSNKGRTDI